jgi:hypothetical protein
MTEIDERYKEGKIYAIRNITDDTIIYVGSTIRSLTQRFNKHKSDCKSGKTCSLYKYIDNNDWTLWYIELYENYPCNSKKELNKREGKLIRDIGTLNMNIAGRTSQEYRTENADKWKEINKKYREDNVDKIKEKRKKYYKDNADNIKEQHKIYREENVDILKERQKKYGEKYRKQNKDIIKEKRN